MDQLLDTDQVLTRYQISARTLYDWKKNLGLPYMAFGKEHRYDQTELLVWESVYKMNQRSKELTVGKKPAPGTNLTRYLALSSHERDDK